MLKSVCQIVMAPSKLVRRKFSTLDFLSRSGRLFLLVFHNENFLTKSGITHPFSLFDSERSISIVNNNNETKIVFYYQTKLINTYLKHRSQLSSSSWCGKFRKSCEKLLNGHRMFCFNELKQRLITEFDFYETLTY